MSAPYFADEHVTLYHGDMRTVIPELGLQADLILTDPPYGQTSLTWDTWPTGWLQVARVAAAAMWCSGSLRTFMAHAAEFASAGWRLSHDIVGVDEDNQPVYGDVTTLWEKQNGSGFHNDRFKGVHEWLAHWYAGPWADAHHEVPTSNDAVARQVRRKQRPPHMGQIERGSYTSVDGGPRLMRSVLRVRNMHGRAIHETEKPLGLLVPAIEYACPPGGTVLDPFAGSGSTAAAARLSGRRAVLVEAVERYCEAAANRLQQGLLDIVPAGAAGGQR